MFLQLNKRQLLLLASLTILVSSLFAQETDTRRRVAGVGAGPIYAGPIYLDAYVTPDPEGPTVHCDNPGIACVINARLLVAARPTPSHDQTLQEATAAINRILASLKPPAGKRLCIYLSVVGPVLIWVQDDVGGTKTLAADVIKRRIQQPQRITDPKAIAEALGLRQVAGAGGNRKAEVVLDPILGPIWTCPNPGKDCVIHQFAIATARTPAQDASLANASREINQILENAAAKAPRPEQKLCLLLTPDGPMLAWTFDKQLEGRRIDSSHPEFRRFAREALGLAP